jgi:hypothetical protein
MNYNLLSRLVIVSLLIIGLYQTLSAQDTLITDFKPDYSSALKFLFESRLSGEFAELKEPITFKKDVSEFRLNEGKLFLCNQYNETNHLLLFIGKGEYSFSPPTQIEKDQLQRFFEFQNYNTSFVKLFLMFDDNTYTEVLEKLSLGKTETKSENRELEDCVEYLKEADYGYSRSDFLRAILTEQKNGFFFAHINPSTGSPVFFQINPFEVEEVTFMRMVSGLSKKGLREIVCQFDAQQNTLTNYPASSNKQFLNLISYKIESTIEDNLDFSAKCIIDFTSKEKEQNWITFYLYEELNVHSVKWEDGKNTKFVRLKDNDELWIKCKDELLDGEQHTLTINYGGELLDNNTYDVAWIQLKSSIYWYPGYDIRNKTYFGLKFHSPVEYDLVSIGDLIESGEMNGVRTTTWVTNYQTRNASFYLGKYQKFEIKENNLPEVNVYISQYGHNQLSQWFNQIGIYAISDATEYIGQDVANSAKLFTELFGPPVISSLRVTESPFFHGEAFPGLIHLSWVTVMQTNFKGEDEIFRAHEVAHQWWGITVDFKTYHDQWLSEGLSEYSGLWYLQAAKNDNDLFFDILKEWKDQIINVRKNILGSGTEAGPVWLGYRTHTRDTSGDYYLIIYKKGAWIMHMLRALLLDLNTMNENKMKKMMKEFYSAFKNKSASTEDFKKITDKHCGEDMTWFFDQYVYGTDIPLYKFAFRAEQMNDGKFKIIIRVRQENVKENFKMYVPLKLVLPGEVVARTRMLVKGKETILEIPNLPDKPDEVIFNDLESVLCEVDEESW